MILDRFKLNNKTALITGGTRGIGLAIAHAFGEAGAKLFIVSRTDNKKGIKSLIDAGYNAKLIEADLSDPTKPNEIVNLIINKKELVVNIISLIIIMVVVSKIMIDIIIEMIMITTVIIIRTIIHLPINHLYLQF